MTTAEECKRGKGFLGLTGYYREFIRDYGKRARSLSELTKEEWFKWTPRAQEAFDWLKQQLSTALVLALPISHKNSSSRVMARGKN